MPKSCCVYGCTANAAKNSETRFFIVPNEVVRRKKWLSFIGRAIIAGDGRINPNKMWSPKSPHTYVCSAHFITGQKSNDPSHPDYVPSIKSGIVPTTQQSEAKAKRYERSQKRKRASLESLPTKKKVRRQIDLDSAVKCDDGEEMFDFDNVDIVVVDKDAEDELAATLSPSAMPDPKDTPLNRPVEQSEREQLYMEISKLREERDSASAEVSRLTSLLAGSNLSSASVEGDDSASKMMTGLSWDVLKKLFEFIATKFKTKNSAQLTLPLREQLFITLVKLRYNVSFDFLAKIRGIPKTTCIDSCWRCIDLLHANIGFMVKMSDRDNIFRTIPPVFKQKFPRLTSIIDCFEVFIEAPKALKARAQCYSSYKHHTTAKVFISCTPLGAINFVSKSYGGKASDNQIVRDSGFINLKYHNPGDQILADRGFMLKEDFMTYCGSELITPAFTKGKKQLPAWEVEHSRSVSSVRIHIERVIGLMRNKYTILKGVLPLRCVQRLKDEREGSETCSFDKIIRVCAALTNLCESIVYSSDE